MEYYVINTEIIIWCLLENLSRRKLSSLRCVFIISKLPRRTIFKPNLILILSVNSVILNINRPLIVKIVLIKTVYWCLFKKWRHVYKSTFPIILKSWTTCTYLMLHPNTVNKFVRNWKSNINVGVEMIPSWPCKLKSSSFLGYHEIGDRKQQSLTRLLLMK